MNRVALLLLLLAILSFSGCGTENDAEDGTDTFWLTFAVGYVAFLFALLSIQGIRYVIIKSKYSTNPTHEWRYAKSGARHSASNLEVYGEKFYGCLLGGATCLFVVLPFAEAVTFVWYLKVEKSIGPLKLSAGYSVDGISVGGYATLVLFWLIAGGICAIFQHYIFHVNKSGVLWSNWERAQYPKVPLIAGVIFVGMPLSWSIWTLVTCLTIKP